ncbi:hypothetical protein FDECE_12018 [Fusarium decemcellulare]|nr:hypothetical protein FDECE_12018 [Fusarium decemcellulare]
MPPSNAPAHASPRLDRLRDTIPKCEGMLKELKILSEQPTKGPGDPYDYRAPIEKLCKNITQNICEDLLGALEEPGLDDLTTDVPREQSGQKGNMPKGPISTETQKDGPAIYVKERAARRKVPRRTPRGHRNPALRTSPRRQSTSNTFVRPTPNEVYVAYWPMSKSWFAVLVLSFDDVEKFGLIGSMPPCYDFNKHTGQVEWKQGYEDDGPLVVEREFPVIFLDGANALDKGAIGWVAAKDLQSFDNEGSQASLIPHYDSVRAFIRNRRAPSVDDACSRHHYTDHETREDPQSASALSVATTVAETLQERDIGSRQLTAVEATPTRQFSSSEDQAMSERAESTTTKALGDTRPHSTGRAESRDSACQTTIATLPASIYLTKPTRISMSGNSPTSYDLPPLNAGEPHKTYSLPNLQSVLESTSTLPYSSPRVSSHHGRTDAAYRIREPTARPAITWPSLSKQRYMKQRNYRSSPASPSPFDMDTLFVCKAQPGIQDGT